MTFWLLTLQNTVTSSAKINPNVIGVTIDLKIYKTGVMVCAAYQSYCAVEWSLIKR